MAWIWYVTGALIGVIADNKISNLQAHLNYLNSNSRNQRDEISLLKTQLSEAASTLKTQQNVITALQSELEFNVTNLQNNLEKTTSDLHTEIKTIRSTSLALVDNQISNLQQQIADSQTVVAFTAKLAKDLEGFEHVQTIQFQDVITNIKEAYNPDTGVFLCPINGLYHFSVTILSFPELSVDTGLYVSGVKKMLTSSEGLTNDSGSTSGVFHLKAGDDVCVKVFFGNYEKIHSGYSSFSGHLISTI